jgi:RNA polymerase sigma factor (sigma-70 family)
VADRLAARHFVTTRWSIVLAAGTGAPSEVAHEALRTLCETYWYPLYAFLRSRGHDPEDAEDLTQAFFARLLEKQSLRHADPARGRFRSFLLTSLKHFAANEYQRGAAQKRGGGAATISLEFERGEGRFQLEPATSETPESSFDRAWAFALLERVIARLEAEMAATGRAPQFVRLKAYLTGDEPQTSYAEAARDLGASAGAIKVAVHRLRRRFRDLIGDEIAQTVASPEEIEDELRHLRAAVARHA